MEVSTLNPVATRNQKGIMTYLKPEVYEKLKTYADKDGRSVSNLVAKILADWVEEVADKESK